MVSFRSVVFRNECVYHLFNRGVERRPIFFSSQDHERFISLLEYYRFHGISKSYSHFLKCSVSDRVVYRQILEQKPIAVDIIAYCLMPNHFHIAARQNIEGGIHQYISNVTNAYTKYINTKRKRVGPLYQGPFKAVLVETDEQLLHLSRYIHINPVVSSVISLDKLDSYRWSSFPDYLKDTQQSFVNKQIVLGHFKNTDSYRNFIYNQVDYTKELENIKHLTFEEV